MNRYDTYKDSGIPWLGEVPSHWNMIKNKYILEFSKGLTITREHLTENGIPCVNYGEIHSKYGFEVNPAKHLLKCVPEEYLINHQNALLKNGDFIFADTSEDIKGSGNFTHLNSELPVFAGYHTIIARPNSKVVFPKFLAYVFDSNNYRNQIRARVKGVKVFSITQAFLKNTFVWLPPLTEQTAIADYLDTKLDEIDTLIDKQQILLEKLAEQRSAIITQAVTKGLNPNAPMKASGVEWLGDVPEHWESWKITHSINLIGSGTTPKSDNEEYYNGNILWVTTSELRENVIFDTKQKVTTSAIKDYSALKIYPKNSVAIAMYGATIGRLGILGKNATFNQACCVFENSETLHYKFLFYWLWYRRPILVSLSNGGGQPNLSQDDLRKLKLPLPNYEEQTAIADYLDQETAKIDRLCETVNQTIGRLKEYRSALITQVVTGKIKVV
ncbi:restriction endonuclease subunit S [Spirabiliibacterium falconis]|uniref:restriction endonuclease subunit S n=1 Tax=Spirabiliibacterium falconis TaxID=572023 RepID=UPI001AAC707F|nr:restriction endonuclease subunit S [Spirabiliibacterium falconis]MBE2893918.1 restriction endonuclease subunit S [Spirabiliibacterium falconis]